MRRFIISVLTVFMCLTSVPVYAEGEDTQDHEHEHTQETVEVDISEEEIIQEENTDETVTEQPSQDEGVLIVEGVYADLSDQEPTLHCDKEEHIHNEEDCFDNYRVLICENEDAEHIHDEECYKTYSFLVCDKQEHIHDENCYDENYVEPVEEVDEAALKAKQEFEELLNKAINEEDGFFLACEKIEHTHTPECFEYKEDLICDKQEITDEADENYHIHNDECYNRYYVVSCEEHEEHTHTMECIKHTDELGEVENLVTTVESGTFDSEIDHSDIPADETIEEETPIRSLMRAPRLLGANNDNQITIREFVVQQFYGGKMESGKYTWTANYNTPGHRFSFRLNYALGGVGEIEEVGAVTITIPKQILRDRNGNFAGTYEMSIPSKRDVDSGEEIDRDINFAYYEDGNNIVIYNFKKISAGENGYIELSYLTNKPASSYRDMGKSDDFAATLSASNNGQTVSSTSSPLNVYINTNVKISSTSKGFPSRYTSWNSSWGSEPANSGDYYYLVWTINTTISSPATQPYNFTLQDNLKTANGEVIGYKFSGQSTYSMNNTVTNQIGDGYRYDYILTKHPKSYWQPLEHWEITNTVTATVDPIDQIDADTNAKASSTYVWNKPVFTIPSGHFNSWKIADGYYRKTHSTNLTALGMKAGEYSRYDLEEFQDGTITELGNLDYAVWMAGYPYPWTYQANSSLGQKDPNNYGILKVKFEMIDEGVYLWDEAAGLNENLPLDYNDFEIDTIAYEIRNRHVTGFNDESQTYIISSNIFDNDDILTFYGKFENSDWVKIVTYKPIDGTIWFDADYVESMTDRLIKLKDNCVAYKIDTTNSHYYTEVNTVPNMHLKNSAKVMNFVQGKQSIGIYNKQAANFYKQDGSLIVNTGDADSNYVRVTQKDSYIFKDSVAATNNVKKKYYAISWKVGMTEQYIAGEGRINYIEQESGVFYDLLPEGATLDVNSVSVRAGTYEKSSSPSSTAGGMKYRTGQFLPSTAYTVEQIPNYNNTGRNLLIVRIKEQAYYYDIFFDTIHSWDSISDWGNDVYNPVAYETGNDKIKYGTNNNGGSIDESSLMANLPSDAQGEKFIYAQSYFDIATITAASTGLTKKVKALDDKDYSYDTITTNDGDYKYRWRIASSFTSKTKNIILFDTMENYVVDGKHSDWHGTLQSIDLSQPKSMGINPIMYYSTIENLDIETNHDITDSSVWHRLTDQTDLLTIKALAADLRKTTSGSDFVLEEGQSLSIILHMKAPHEAESQGTYPEAYNNIYLQDTVIGLSGSAQDFFIHQDYTTVRIVIAEDLTLKKVSSEDEITPLKDLKFRLKGTSDYGTEEDRIVATDISGMITFKDIEKGSYILSEYESTQDWLLNPAEYTVTIDGEGILTITGQENSNFLDFTYNNGIYTLTIKDDPRVHGDITLLKRREGDSADDIEVKQMLANANIGDTITYNDKEYTVLEKTNSKVKLGEPEREMTTKYAVQIYGIEYDTLEDGSTAGLTFGPALGRDFMNTYISHTPSGNTTLGNAHRCIHDDNWETIIYWNNVDPYVYEQCVEQNCTHSVELSLSDTLTNPRFVYGGSASGDGVSALYYELNSGSLSSRSWNHLKWTGERGTNAEGWGASRIRAMLNGLDTDNSDGIVTNMTSATVLLGDWADPTCYTESEALISAFPTVLQNAIGARATLYDSVYNRRTEANLKTTYDKLWLLSPYEMADSISSSYYQHPLEVPNGKYQKFIENNLDLSTSDNIAFEAYQQSSNTGTSGIVSVWWLRSSSSYSDRSVLGVSNVGKVIYVYPNDYYGVAPCFSLARNANSASDNSIWVDYTIKPQTPISGTAFKLSGISDYGTDTTKLETTNTAGRVTFTDIELGTYTLEEIVPNSDYILNNTKWTVKVDEQGNVSVIEPDDEILRDRLYTVEQVGNNYVIFNEPRYWNFTLRKIDKENETIWLEGAEFTLTGISDLGTEYNEVVESNEAGRVIFERIEKGTYILKETRAPQGVTETGAQGGNRNYIADSKEYIVKIDNQGNVTIDGLSMNQYDDYVVKNDRAYDGKITIVKKWEDNSDNDNRPEPVVHLSTTEPTWRHGITVTKVWEGDSAEDRPEDIKVHLISNANVTPVFTEIENDFFAEVQNNNIVENEWVYQYDQELGFDSVGVLVDEIKNERGCVMNVDDTTSAGPLLLIGFSNFNHTVNGPEEQMTAGNYYIDIVVTSSNINVQFNKRVNDLETNIENINNNELNTILTAAFTRYQTGEVTAQDLYNTYVEVLKILYPLYPSYLKPYLDNVGLVLEETRVNGWTKNADNTWTYTFDILLEDENADKEFYVWEEPVEGYTTENGESNPVLVQNQAATITNEKLTTKYAVQIYGIGQDTLQDGSTAGLTFGPALGQDFMNTYISHTPSGLTDGSMSTDGQSHEHRCIHNDGWETIVYWNKLDPAVYEQCIAENCTHSVNLTFPDYLKNTSFVYGGSSSGDGVGILYNEFNNSCYHRSWNPINKNTSYGTNEGGWGASRIRAMMNGYDELTMLKGSYSYYNSSIESVPETNYTSGSTLIDAFPQILQDNIGARKTLYDSVYNSKTAANLKTSYDKLWLLSPYEMADSISDSYYQHPLEAPNGKYQKFVENNINLSTSYNTAFRAYRQNGNTGTGTRHHWWLRSSNSDYAHRVLLVNSYGGVDRDYAYYNYGVSPCFSLKR